MGELYIERPNGESTIYKSDGTVINENKGLDIDWCDLCQKWQRKLFGVYAQTDGLALIWICKGCQ